MFYAYDGKDGYQKARNHKPDIINLDIILPQIDGYRICDLLKKDKRYSGIRILVITGKSDEETIGLATKCGADGYLVKPFTFEDVLDKVTAILGATD